MKHFSIQEALSFGWKTFKKNPWLLIGVTATVSLLPTLIQYALQLPFQNSSNADSYNPMMLIGTIASTAVSIFLTIGMIKFTLKLVDDKKVEYQDIFSVTIDEYMRYFLSSVLYGLMVFAGILLLIVPGIYFAIKYQYYSYLVIDKKKSVMDSLKGSGEITKGHIGQLILFSLAIMGVSILGVLVLLVGVLVASPVVAIAQAYVYRKLSATHAK